jgi:hypothetical protein
MSSNATAKPTHNTTVLGAVWLGAAHLIVDA